MNKIITMTIKEQIIERERQLISAMKTSDVNKLDELIHDNLLFTNHLGQIISKQDDLEAYRSGNLLMKDIFSEQLKIQEFDEVIITSLLAEIKGTYLDQAFNNKIRFTRIWKNINDSWKIIAGSSVVIAN